MPSIQIVRENGDVEDYFLPGREITIGRVEQNELVLNDFSVSRKHARLFLEGETWVIEDLGSHNGTLVNQKIIQKTELKDGDHIKIGNNHLVFKADEITEEYQRTKALPVTKEPESAHPEPEKLAAEVPEPEEPDKQESPPLPPEAPFKSEVPHISEPSQPPRPAPVVSEPVAIAPESVQKPGEPVSEPAPPVSEPEPFDSKPGTPAEPKPSESVTPTIPSSGVDSDRLPVGKPEPSQPASDAGEPLASEPDSSPPAPEAGKPSERTPESTRPPEPAPLPPPESIYCRARTALADFARTTALPSGTAASPACHLAFTRPGSHGP